MRTGELPFLYLSLTITGDRATGCDLDHRGVRYFQQQPLRLRQDGPNGGTKFNTMINIPDIDQALGEAFGRPSDTWHPTDPLVKLIECVLRQRTTSAHVRHAMDNLEQHCSGWAGVAALPHDLLADLLRPAGLAQQKAARIHGILAQIYLETGTYSLDCLHDMENRKATRLLRALPGVGVHTAALVLLFALGRPGIMPVETHVHRVARRLGWVDADATALAVQQAVEAAAPAHNLLDLHVNLVRLGHRHCPVRTPDCGNCPLHDHCAHARLQPWW